MFDLLVSFSVSCLGLGLFVEYCLIGGSFLINAFVCFGGGVDSRLSACGILASAMFFSSSFCVFRLCFRKPVRCYVGFFCVFFVAHDFQFYVILVLLLLDVPFVVCLILGLLLLDVPFVVCLMLGLLLLDVPFVVCLMLGLLCSI